MIIVIIIAALIVWSAVTIPGQNGETVVDKFTDMNDELIDD